MKKNTQKESKPVGVFQKVLHFFERKPMFGYLALMIALMSAVLIADQGTNLFKASIVQAPTFDGTISPVRFVPNWAQTGGKNDRHFNDYATSELIELPQYDGDQLKRRCAKNDSTYRNECITYSTVYMGSYKMDHEELSGSHIAVDIRMPTGTPVRAIANGVVETSVSKTSGFGKYIVIRHDGVPLPRGGTGTLYSGYAHLSDRLVEKGAAVKKGEIIGKSGSTGTSTTPHLHFQIDTKSAPYHPWWPFTSAQVSAANLNFFTAINAGLGQADGLVNTVSPMKWVQDNTKEGATHSAAPSPPKEEPLLLTTFEMESSKQTAEVGEKIFLTLKALDQNKNLLKKQQKEATLTADTEGITLSKPVFVKGKAAVSATASKAGTFTIALREGNISASLRLIITKKPSVTNIADFTFDAQKTVLFSGDETSIMLSALNEDGDILLKITEPITLILEGSGKISKTTLDAKDFENGVATITFSAKKSGTTRLSVKNFSASTEIEVIDKIKAIDHFEIESDGRFEVGKRETVRVIALDATGKKTPKIFRGSLLVSLKSGKGVLKNEKLTADDFQNSIAEVSFVPTSEGDIVIRVAAGVLVGESKPIRVSAKEISKPLKNTEKVESAFSDVDENNNHFDAISFLKSQKIIKGNPDGRFLPNTSINRAEFAKILLLALDIEPVVASGDIFTDVPVDQWFAPFAEAAAAEKIINGYPDGSFGAGNSINRAEMFAMLFRASGESVNRTTAFSDVPKDAWFADAAIFAQEKKLLDFGEKFFPEKVMTRGEVAEAVYRFLQR